jgi:hypothetical protein
MLILKVKAKVQWIDEQMNLKKMLKKIVSLHFYKRHIFCHNSIEFSEESALFGVEHTPRKRRMKWKDLFKNIKNTYA